MSKERLAIVILAAGMGTRMKSDRPKVLHELAGKAMLRHVIDAVAPLAPERIVLVVGPDMAAVSDAAAPHPSVVQTERLGTGHAVLAARTVLDGYQDAGCGGRVLVLYGDAPLVTTATLERMLTASREGAAVVVLGFHARNPAPYGRMVCDPATGGLLRVVEALDASPEERAIDLCNAGMVLAEGSRLFALLDQVGNDNAKGEYYLTDIFGLAAAQGCPARVVEAPEDEVQGINSRAELAQAEAALQDRLRAQAMAGGATLIDPATVWFCHDTIIGRDVLIEPSVVFGPGVTVEDGSTIRAFCHLTQAHLGPGVEVGPFARLRPGARLEEKSKVGNFVEMKNSTLGPGAKVNHLSYLGDTTVGAKANVGAGTITCNYDGFGKHRTEIGAGAFIGSNSALVAPVTIGAGAIVAAGSTISRDVAPDSLAIERSQQQVREGAAARFRDNRGVPKVGRTAKTVKTVKEA